MIADELDMMDNPMNDSFGADGNTNFNLVPDADATDYNYMSTREDANTLLDPTAVILFNVNAIQTIISRSQFRLMYKSFTDIKN